MGIKSSLNKRVNCTQIKALLWKDVLVRIRQPVSLFCLFFLKNCIYCSDCIQQTGINYFVCHFFFFFFAVVDIYSIRMANFDICRIVFASIEIRCKNNRRMPISHPAIAVVNRSFAIFPVLYLHS